MDDLSKPARLKRFSLAGSTALAVLLLLGAAPVSVGDLNVLVSSMY
jgi:hypothetical protein